MVHDYEVNLEDLGRVRQNVRMVGFPTQSPGRYTFRVEQREQETMPWTECASLPIEVKIVRPETAGQGNGQAH